MKFLFSFCFFFPVELLLWAEGRARQGAQSLAAAFLMVARTLLSSSYFPLVRMCVPTFFLMNLKAHLSLETLSYFMGCCPTGWSHTPLGSYPAWTWCVWSGTCQAPVVAAGPGLAHILGHLVALVESHGCKVEQSHGCCSPVAAKAYKYLKFPPLLFPIFSIYVFFLLLNSCSFKKSWGQEALH